MANDAMVLISYSTRFGQLILKWSLRSESPLDPPFIYYSEYQLYIFAQKGSLNQNYYVTQVLALSFWDSQLSLQKPLLSGKQSLGLWWYFNLYVSVMQLSTEK